MYLTQIATLLIMTIESDMPFKSFAETIECPQSSLQDVARTQVYRTG